MEREEFAQRITQMHCTLYRICTSQLSCAQDREDAVQEALKKAWERRRQLRNDALLQAWVIRILLNECHKIQRQRKRLLLTDRLMDPDAPAPEAAPEGLLLRQALRQLPEKLRVPLVLHYLEGYGVQETARILRLPPGTVKTRMRAGRAQLKLLLDEEVFEDENK